MKTFFSSFATKYWVVNSFILPPELKAELSIFVAKESFHKDENRLNWENGIVYENKFFNYFVIINKTARSKLCFYFPGFQ